MDQTEKYTVIIKNPEGVDHKLLANALARYYKLIHYEAETAARKSRGFIAEKIEKSEAEALLKICVEEGVPALVLPEAEIPALNPPLSCVSAEFLPETFKYLLRNKESGSVGWDEITVVSSAAIPGETIKTTKQKPEQTSADRALKIISVTTMGIPVTFGKKKEVTKVTKEMSLAVHLELFLDKPPYRLHINASDFNYAYLQARKEYNTVTNFSLMAQDINSYARKALKNSGFTKMMRKEMLSQQGYDSYESFEKESRWLVSLTRWRLGH
jgi:hypothetical protein